VKSIETRENEQKECGQQDEAAQENNNKVLQDEMLTYEIKALKNIAQAHGFDEIDAEDREFYLETNTFYRGDISCREYYEDLFEYLLNEGKIVKTDDGYVAINVV